jgi:beta-galactosidase
VDLRFADGTTDSGTIWSEWIETEGAEVVASFASGELAGRPAITRHAFGQGVAWYLGTRPDLGPLLDRVTAEAGVTPVLAAPPGVQAVVRHGEESAYLLLLNHGTAPVTVDLPRAAPDLLGDPSRPLHEVRLAPRGVAVLKG